MPRPGIRPPRRVRRRQHRKTRRRVAGVLAAAVAILSAAILLITGGSSAEGAERTATAASATASATASAPTTVTLPPTTGAFDYQLGGSYAPGRGVTVVTRDSTSIPAPGVYSICYVNAFQTQPGARWPAALILHRRDGKPLVDAGWPGEHLIDTSTAAKRATAATRQEKTIAGCASKRFQAVEFDNLDSWTRSKGALTRGDAVAFATALTTFAHAQGLAVAQKNTAQLGATDAHEIGFDFATTEQCDRYRECAAFTSIYGAHVLDVEYTGGLRGSFAAVCARAATPRQTIVRDLDLVARGHHGYVYRHC